MYVDRDAFQFLKILSIIFTPSHYVCVQIDITILMNSASFTCIIIIILSLPQN